MSARPPFLAFTVALLACSSAPKAVPVEPPLVAIEVDGAAGRAMLAALGKPSDFRSAAVSFALDLDGPALAAALAARSGPFAAATDSAAIDAAIAKVEAAVRGRTIAIARAVERFLPPAETAPAAVRVALVFGLPEARVLALAQDGDVRVVLLDAPRLVATTGESDLGERLQRLVAPEAFHAACDRALAANPRWQPRAGDPLGTVLRGCALEGVADYLASPADEQFDAEGKHSPVLQARAVAAVRRFEQDVNELIDPSTTAERRDELVFTATLQPPRWAAAAGLEMVDAVVRFGAAGRMREVLAAGPGELFAAYGEVCSRYAALPRMTPQTRFLCEQS